MGNAIFMFVFVCFITGALVHGKEWKERIEELIKEEENNQMKSILIKDTTKQERIELIREWLPVDDGLEDCEIDLWDMYDAYIKGEKEISEINAEFQTDYFAG